MKVAPFITRVATAIKWKQAQRRRIGAADGRPKAAEVAGQLPNMRGAPGAADGRHWGCIEAARKQGGQYAGQ